MSTVSQDISIYNTLHRATYTKGHDHDDDDGDDTLTHVPQLLLARLKWIERGNHPNGFPLPPESRRQDPQAKIEHSAV